MESGTLIIVAFVSLLVGYLAGWILTRMSYSKPDAEADPESNYPGSRLELLKFNILLWRKDKKSPVRADVFGKTIKSPEDLSLAEKSRLTGELRAIQTWLGLPVMSSSPSLLIEESLPVQIEDHPEGTPTVSTEQVAPSDAMPDGDLPASLPPISVPPFIEQPVSDRVKPVEAKISLGNTPKPEPVVRSIVQQIDDILQEKVTHSPLANTGIKLQETPQGVLVWVGSQSYQGVDMLPEGEAKALINAAVREWERRE